MPTKDCTRHGKLLAEKGSVVSDDYYRVEDNLGSARTAASVISAGTPEAKIDLRYKIKGLKRTVTLIGWRSKHILRSGARVTRIAVREV